MQPHLLDQAALIITSSPVLVNVISRRVRQLMNGHRPLVEARESTGFADTALSEVIAGKLTYETTEELTPEYLFQKGSESKDVLFGNKAA